MNIGRYKIIKEFDCCGKHMVIIKLEHGTHVMTEDEWRWTFGQSRPERWENGVRVNKNRNRKSA